MKQPVHHPQSRQQQTGSVNEATYLSIENRRKKTEKSRSLPVAFPSFRGIDEQKRTRFCSNMDSPDMRFTSLGELPGKEGYHAVQGVHLVL
jgi:hypothetical protein